MTQPTNKCYKRVYVNDMIGSTLTVNGKRIVNSDYMGADSIPITDLGILETDAFGNDFYSVVKNYQRCGTFNGIDGQVDILGPYTGNDNYKRTTFEKIKSGSPIYPGFEYICQQCTSTGPIPITVPPSPASCSIFLKNAEAWNRTNDTCGPVTNRVLVNDIPIPKANTPESYVEKNVDNEPFDDNGCMTKSPFIVYVPAPAGGLAFTYMNGEFILTIEGDTVVSADNTTILVEK